MPNGSNLERIVLAQVSVNFVNFANESPYSCACIMCTHRVCVIKSVDGSNITTYCVHECEAANRIGMRSRRFVFTGHTNGAIQVPLLFVRREHSACIYLCDVLCFRCGILPPHLNWQNKIQVCAHTPAQSVPFLWCFKE